MEIPGGWGGGFKLKNHPWGGMDIFWNHTIYQNIECLYN